VELKTLAICRRIQEVLSRTQRGQLRHGVIGVTFMIDVCKEKPASLLHDQAKKGERRFFFSPCKEE